MTKMTKLTKTDEQTIDVVVDILRYICWCHRHGRLPWPSRALQLLEGVKIDHRFAGGGRYRVTFADGESVIITIDD